MTNFIPIFPLGIVVYPGEKVHLHIFEPRYKQLINECQRKQEALWNSYCSKQSLTGNGYPGSGHSDIVQTYDNGEMDVKTQGLKVFRVLEVIKASCPINCTAAPL